MGQAKDHRLNHKQPTTPSEKASKKARLGGQAPSLTQGIRDLAMASNPACVLKKPAAAALVKRPAVAVKEDETKRVKQMTFEEWIQNESGKYPAWKECPKALKPAPKDVVGAGSWIARDAGKAAVSVILTKNAFWVMSANVKLTRRHISWSEAGGLKKAFN